MTARPRVKLFSLAALVLLTMGSLSTPHASASSFTDRLVELTNAQRRAIRGQRCPSLVRNSALAATAQEHAADMATRNYVSHYSSGGATLWQRVSWHGYQARRAAENIAAGPSSPEAVVAGWMRSPGHRANILDCRLREIGAGFVHADGTAYGNYWVEVFGTHR